MKTKVAIKSESVTPFGGIFYIMDEFSHLGMDKLIDRVLGLRCSTYGYQYSEILSSLFYAYYCGADHIATIRASRYESLSNEISEMTDWKQIELNFENYEVTSIPFTAFMEEENYRLVIQRKRKKESEEDLFDGKFVYRCIE